MQKLESFIGDAVGQSYSLKGLLCRISRSSERLYDSRLDQPEEARRHECLAKQLLLLGARRMYVLTPQFAFTVLHCSVAYRAMGLLHDSETPLLPGEFASDSKLQLVDAHLGKVRACLLMSLWFRFLALVLTGNHAAVRGSRRRVSAQQSRRAEQADSLSRDHAPGLGRLRWRRRRGRR